MPLQTLISQMMLDPSSFQTCNSICTAHKKIWLAAEKNMFLIADTETHRWQRMNQVEKYTVLFVLRISYIRYQIS